MLVDIDTGAILLVRHHKVRTYGKEVQKYKARPLYSGKEESLPKSLYTLCQNRAVFCSLTVE